MREERAGCPPNSSYTTVGLNVPGVANVSALNAECTMDPATGTTVAEASVDGASLLGGLISITNIETSCRAGADGFFGSSRAGYRLITDEGPTNAATVGYGTERASMHRTRRSMR